MHSSEESEVANGGDRLSLTALKNFIRKMYDLGAVQVAIADIYVDFRSSECADPGTEALLPSEPVRSGENDIFNLPSGADPEDGDAYWRRRPIPARSR